MPVCGHQGVCVLPVELKLSFGTYDVINVERTSAFIDLLDQPKECWVGRVHLKHASTTSRRLTHACIVMLPAVCILVIGLVRAWKERKRNKQTQTHFNNPNPNPNPNKHVHTHQCKSKNRLALCQHEAVVAGEKQSARIDVDGVLRPPAHQLASSVSVADAMPSSTLGWPLVVRWWQRRGSILNTFNQLEKTPLMRHVRSSSWRVMGRIAASVPATPCGR